PTLEYHVGVRGSRRAPVRPLAQPPESPPIAVRVDPDRRRQGKGRDFGGATDQDRRHRPLAPDDRQDERIARYGNRLRHLVDERAARRRPSALQTRGRTLRAADDEDELGQLDPRRALDANRELDLAAGRQKAALPYLRAPRPRAERDERPIGQHDVAPLAQR